MSRTTGAPLVVRLDADADAALAALCESWRCGKADAVRRALREAVGTGATLRGIRDAVAEIEVALAADATARNLAAWAMREE